MRDRAFVLLSVLFLLGIVFVACSSNDDSTTDVWKTSTTDVQKAITGKWKQILKGDLEVDSEHYLEFYENGYVKFEINVGTDDYRFIDSWLEIDNDWTVTHHQGVVEKMTGHLHFMIWGAGANMKEPNSFFCRIEDEKMYLMPADEGERYIMDPSMTFIRVK